MAKSKKKPRPRKRPAPVAPSKYSPRQAAKTYDNEVIDLIDRYLEKYVELGHALSKDALMRLDAIDLRPVLIYENVPEMPKELPDSGLEKDFAPSWASWTAPSHRSFSDLPKEDQARILTLGKYSLVPPFPEGVFRINDNRWLYFRITDLSKLETEEQIGVYIRDYTQVGKTWMPGPGVDTILRHMPEQDTPDSPYTVGGDLNNDGPAGSTKKIYRTLSQALLGWSDREWRKFHSVPQPRAQTEVSKLIRIYNLCVWLVNLFLEKYRPSRPKAGENAAPAARLAVFDGEVDPDERKIRAVGPISVKSKKVPRTQNAETIVRYRLAEWNCRAHVRRYKSGKVAFIKAHTCRRRAVNIDETSGKTAKTPVTIVIKNEERSEKT